ncbi:MAG TPA: hypothetical protein EYQ54_13395 [Myxococcales bacterium]|nr:hypothetical protein [Myxococcales bacterium]HIL81434.1 hypothetical protein [Myxococcales bacterium]
MVRTQFSVLLVVLGLCLSTSTSALAQLVTPAELGLDFDGGVIAPPLVDAVGGREFTLRQPMELYALGVWDEGSDGLLADHEVGLPSRAPLGI